MTLLEPTSTSGLPAPPPEAPAVEPAGYTIAEVAERMAISPHTLRYYERIGLLAVERDAGGRRVYRDHDLARIRFISCLRATNLPIRRLQRYFELADIGPGTEPERLAVLQEHREDVIAQLDEVRNALAAIEFKIELYAGSGCAVPRSGPRPSPEAPHP